MVRPSPVCQHAPTTHPPTLACLRARTCSQDEERGALALDNFFRNTWNSQRPHSTPTLLSLPQQQLLGEPEDLLPMVVGQPGKGALRKFTGRSG